MGIAFNSAVSANIQILQKTNEAFQVSQKRVATGKMIFGASDDATRYKMSETMLGRSRQISDVNNNISIALKTLEATDKTLASMQKLVEAAQDLARKAQAEGAESARSATSTANLTSATVLAAASVGEVFSMTSDSGQTFTYTFQNSTTTRGAVTDALNAANIGVQAEFVPNGANSNLRFKSTNGKDFTFNNTTDRGIMTVLAGLASPSGQVYTPASLFQNGVTAPAAGETGFTVGYGGQVAGTKTPLTNATAVAAASVLVFKDGFGATRTLNYTVASTVGQVISDINAMGAGIKAELVNQTGVAGAQVLRLRNTMGGNMEIVMGNGAFGSTGTVGLVPASGTATANAAALSTNNTVRLEYGRQYDAIVANLSLMVANNPVTSGRNLLNSQNMAVVMDEFTGVAVNITGVNVSTAAALGLTGAGTAWTTDANIQTSATQAATAVNNLRNYQAQFSTFNSYMKARYDINSSFSKDLETLGNELVAADVAEESANLTALQTQQSFAVQAFSMGSQTQQGLLRLLG